MESYIICMKPYVYTKKKKRLSKRAKARVFLFSILVVVVLLCVYYFLVIAPIVVSLSEEKVRSLSTQVVSASVEEVLRDEAITYDDLVKIEYNSNREISLISTNSVEINLFVRKVTYLVQNRMDTLGAEGVDIALGTFTGIPFLYGLGPMVSVKLVPVGTVNTAFASTFTSAGINQTLHRLYFTISINVGMILPSMTKNLLTELQVEICESVIVGKVPDVYLQGQII